MSRAEEIVEAIKGSLGEDNTSSLTWAIKEHLSSMGLKDVEVEVEKVFDGVLATFELDDQYIPVLFSVIDSKPHAMVETSEGYFDIDISEIAEITRNGIFDDNVDLAKISEWSSPELIHLILNTEDSISDSMFECESEDGFDERFKFVIRGGKKVKKKIRIGRKKRVKASTRALLKRAAKRSGRKASTKRKRAKSLKIRKRMNLK